MKNIEEIRKEKKSTINFGSVPFEAYVHAICNNVSDIFIKAQELLMLHRAFMTANEIYEIYVPARIRELSDNFYAGKAPAGDVIKIMEELVGILNQDTNKSLIKSMYVEVPAIYFQTAEDLEGTSKQESAIECTAVRVTEAGDGKLVVVELKDGSTIFGIKVEKEHQVSMDRIINDWCSYQ